MKFLNKIFISIFCLTLILITFIKMDTITDFFVPFIEQDTKIEISPSNNYKKDINYLFIQNTNNFGPLSKQDIKNIFYTIVNNGWQTFSYYCPKEYSDCLKDSEYISQDKDLLTHINNFVHPYNGFSNIETIIKESGQVTVNVTYFYNEDHINAINKKVDELYNELINDQMTDREKIKTIHDYIINNTKYDITRNEKGESIYQSYLAYGLLFEGYATCNGYTDTMALFLDKMNIPNFKVAMTPDDPTKEGHVWNAVYLDNNWYHLDLTWDDPVSDDGKDYLQDTYFLIDTKKLKEIDNNGEKIITDHNFKENIYLELKEKN